jgi:hypothetical protein
MKHITDTFDVRADQGRGLAARTRLRHLLFGVAEQYPHYEGKRERRCRVVIFRLTRPTALGSSSTATNA